MDVEMTSSIEDVEGSSTEEQHSGGSSIGDTMETEFSNLDSDALNEITWKLLCLDCSEGAVCTECGRPLEREEATSSGRREIIPTECPFCGQETLAGELQRLHATLLVQETEVPQSANADGPEVASEEIQRETRRSLGTPAVVGGGDEVAGRSGAPQGQETGQVHGVGSDGTRRSSSTPAAVVGVNGNRNAKSWLGGANIRRVE